LAYPNIGVEVVIKMSLIAVRINKPAQNRLVSVSTKFLLNNGYFGEIDSLRATSNLREL
jgi:hypothetical protein